MLVQRREVWVTICTNPHQSALSVQTPSPKGRIGIRIRKPRNRISNIVNPCSDIELANRLSDFGNLFEYGISIHHNYLTKPDKSFISRYHLRSLYPRFNNRYTTIDSRSRYPINEQRYTISELQSMDITILMPIPRD